MIFSTAVGYQHIPRMFTGKIRQFVKSITFELTGVRVDVSAETHHYTFPGPVE